MIFYKNLLIGALFLSTNIGLSQIANIQDNSPSYQLTNNSDMAFMSIRIVSTGEEAPKGSLYLNEHFMAGTILFHDTKQKMFIPVRYNAFENEIEVQREDNILAIRPTKDMEVRYDKKFFVSVQNPKTGKRIFAQKIAGGKYELYDFFKAKVHKAPTDAGLLNLEQKDEIEIKSNLHFQVDGGGLIPLPTRKKELIHFFEPSQLSFLKEKNLNLKKGQDAMVFFRYLNSLE